MDTVKVIRSELRPGEPLLVTGPRGSGKFQLAREALDPRQIYINASQIAEGDLSRALNDLYGASVILHELEQMTPGVESEVRHFLATTSRTVVVCALSEESTGSLRPLFRKVVPIDMKALWESWAGQGSSG